MLSWISEQFSHYKPDRAIAVRALRHMRPAERKNLFSEDIMLMRTAEGYWFENLIYEQLIRIAEKTDTIKKVVRKGADVPKHREKIRLGVNGIYSAEKGDIRVRGNGQDLAEVDLLLFDKDKQVVFSEIVTSPADLKDLEAEIIYKKKLFGYMFNQEHVGFILFSSVDISGTQVVRRLVADPDNAYIGTHECEVMKSCLKGLRITSILTHPEKNPVLTPSETLKIRDFDYKKLHDDALTKLFFAMDHNMSPDQYFSDPSVSPLVKKVICGGLYPSAIKAVIANYGLRVKSEILDADSIMENYSRVILAVDFPEMSPVIYLKPKKQRTYLKMIPSKTGGFKYERPTPSRVGFYLWLEATKPAIGAERLLSVLQYCNTPVKDCVSAPITALPPGSVVPKHHYHPRRKRK
ncbi:MAG: hypothetical protein Q7J08_05115 [Methanocorpusculum sp.]|uniref:hypothetical protein n=1 Tax=Methanocorpusculum sp. TaxID=2058474 RepID=UPI00271EF2E5|nr:hypothetical protein [Methanocorpusculum sp.]MDO9523078.1 hypothetical protein [Methanocorpusculum sp.]